MRVQRSSIATWAGLLCTWAFMASTALAQPAPEPAGSATRPGAIPARAPESTAQPALNPAGSAGSPAAPKAAPASIPDTPSGPPPTAQLECAPQPVRIAEPLRCTLTIDHRPDVSVTVAAPAHVTREPAGAAETLPDGQLRSTRVLSVIPRSLKPVQVKGLSVTWQEVGGYTGSLPIEPMRVAVHSEAAGVEHADFRSFELPLGIQGGPEATAEERAAFDAAHGALPHSVRNWPLILTLGALAVLLVGGLLGFVIRRWLASRAREPAPFVDLRPAHIIAYERLEALIAQDLPGQGETKQLYFRVSEIVRDYLGRRYGFDALEMTTYELRERLAALAAEGPQGEGRDAVHDFLDETDLVKFADFRPDDEGDVALRMARGLIELTRRPDEVAGGKLPVERPA